MDHLTHIQHLYKPDSLMGSSDREGVVTFPPPRHYDASSKNFLLMKGPGIAAQTRSELVADNDITPSLAELAGVRVPGYYDVDGRSLVRLLRGETVPSWRNALLIEHPAPPIYHDPKPGYESVKTASGGLYIEWENRHVEYYADEFQTEPADDPARRTDLEAKLDALRNCSGESCHAAEDAP
jgi:N-acetylglucosamine-6-sulfatase